MSVVSVSRYYEMRDFILSGLFVSSLSLETRRKGCVTQESLYILYDPLAVVNVVNVDLHLCKIFNVFASEDIDNGRNICVYFITQTGL